MFNIIVSFIIHYILHIYWLWFFSLLYAHGRKKCIGKCFSLLQEETVVEMIRIYLKHEYLFVKQVNMIYKIDKIYNFLLKGKHAETFVKCDWAWLASGSELKKTSAPDASFPPPFGRVLLTRLYSQIRKMNGHGSYTVFPLLHGEAIPDNEACC